MVKGRESDGLEPAANRIHFEPPNGGAGDRHVLGYGSWRNPATTS